MISEFRGETRWLSNFSEVIINYEGIDYFSTEAAYQASKVLDKKIRRVISHLEPRDARIIGKILPLREDWGQIKLKVMWDINRLKFNREPYKSQLLETGNQELVEGNYWNDTFWGVCNGVGENNLGKILMEIREEIKQ